MKKHLAIFVMLAILSMLFTGCATTKKGLEEAMKDIPTRTWYEQANLLVKANDPDLKADTLIGVPALDAIVDTVKDIMVEIPVWSTVKAEEMRFEMCYEHCIEKLQGGSEGKELVVKQEAFATLLMMETFAKEDAHSKAAVSMSKEEKKANYAQNGKVYKEAVDTVEDYVNNHIFPLVIADPSKQLDDKAKKKFFADPKRAQWNERTDEIAKMIDECLELQKKEAKVKLCKEMGVQDVNWDDVKARLSGDLEKLQNALTALTDALQSDQDLAKKVAMAGFGGEIVPGTSGKETLAVINRFRKQLQVNIELIGWLMKNVAH